MRTTPFQKDLAAIATLARIEASDATYPLAVLETRKGSVKIDFADLEDVDYMLDDLLYEYHLSDNSPTETERIAIAYTDKVFPAEGKGAWISIVDDFCEEKIAGVLLVSGEFVSRAFWSILHKGKLKPSRHVFGNPDAGYIHFILDLFPTEEFEKASMPILYDENETLATLFPHADHLKLDERVSFHELMKHPDIEKVLGSAYWLTWLDGPIPFARIDGTDLARSIARKQASDKLGILNNMALSAINTIVARDERVRCAYDGQSAKDLVAFLEDVFGEGVVDRNRMFAFGDGKCMTMQTPSYALELDRNSVEGFSEFEGEIEHATNVCNLIMYAFAEHNIGFYPDDDPRITVSKLKDLVETFGVNHQVEALKNGVPYADVVA